MKKLICFDLDGTLTQHRSPLGEENKAVLDKLSKKYKLIMVGDGGGDSHIRLGGIDYVNVQDYTKLNDLLSYLY